MLSFDRRRRTAAIQRIAVGDAWLPNWAFPVKGLRPHGLFGREHIAKSGGENVSSIEVEKALLESDPGIAEVAVVGLPHARWTEAITAFVVPRPGAEVDTTRLASAARERLSGFKCPKDIVLKDALPKTATGKVQKARLRQLHAAHYDEEG